MEFNLSYEQNPAMSGSNATAELPPLFASVEGRVASLSNNECIFQPRHGGELHVMTHQVLQALDHCREFRPLDEHVARVASVLPGLNGQAEAVRRVLAHLIERRVLISDSDFLGQLETDRATQPAKMTAIAIRACDRPQQLQRLLVSLQTQAGEHLRRDPILLLDDSRSSDAVQAHREALRGHAEALGVPVLHLDADAARNRLQMLAKARPEAADLIAALQQGSAGQGEFGGGRGYNLALLLTAGRRLCLLDDDYVLPFHESSHGAAGLEPASGTAFEVRFHGDQHQAMAGGRVLGEDGFALQQRLVGHRLGSVVKADPALALDRASLRGLALARLAHLRGDARILATYTGTRGASFTSDSLWLYRLSGASRDRFWADRDLYLHNIHAETMEFAPSRVIPRPHGLFTPFMLDNSQLLPCTANSGRGEDGLFGITASYLHPDTLTLHLPITIGHVQEGRRGRFERALQPLTPGVNRFLREWILNQAQPARSADPAERLRFLAAQLDDLAGASVASRVDVLEEYLRYVRADLIEHLQQHLQAAPQAPVYWAADVRRIVETNGRALLARDPPRLDEWPQDLDAEGCAERLSQACRQLASSYRLWPALWQTAAEMGDRLLDLR